MYRFILRTMIALSVFGMAATSAMAEKLSPAEAATLCQSSEAEKRILGCTAIIDAKGKGYKTSLADAFDGRCWAYHVLEQYERAVADCRAAISLNPRYSYAYNNLGTALLGLGQFQNAIDAFTKSISLKTNFIYPYLGRAKALAASGEREAAKRDYEYALIIDPNSQEAKDGIIALMPMPNPAKPQVLVQTSPQLAPAKLVVVQPSLQSAKRALVIGINAYPNLGAAAQLERAVADAGAVGDKLASLGFQVTRLTTAPQTTLDAIIHGFDDFQKTVAPNDMVVLFYAGHGMGLSDGTYLVPSDVSEASLEAESTAKRVAINENELTYGLRQAHAGVVVAVIDTCRNDLFSRAVRRALGHERGLRPAETEDIFKLYSASEGQTALDRRPGGGDASKNSVFTRVYLKALGTPGLNLSALGTTVRDEVYRIARAADHAQTPAVYDKLIGSTQVYFAGETATADGGRAR
jgi:tetratricopeptide (TPR) repeat protein